MLISKIKNFYFGRVIFEGSEGFSSCFLEECRKRNIVIEKTKVAEEHIKGECKYSYLNDIMEAAEKSDMKLNKLKCKGLPAIIHRYKKRIGIPVGILIAAITCIVCSSVIWSVEVSGNVKIASEDLISGLETIGIYRGCFSHIIDCNAAENELQHIFPDILWCAVNIDGSKIRVIIRERSVPPEKADSKTYSNIIAGYSGEIIKADVFEGDKEIGVGSAVVKGDLLVSGVKKLKNGGVIFTDSKASITGRIISEERFSLNNIIAVNVFEKTTDRFGLFFFGLNIPFGPSKKDFKMIKSEYLLDTESSVLPFGITRERFSLLCTGERELTNELQKLILLNEFALCESENYGDADIIMRKAVFNAENGKISLAVNYISERDICVKQNFSVEEN